MVLHIVLTTDSTVLMYYKTLSFIQR